MVPTKDPSNVKSENPSTTLECQSWGGIMCTWVCEGFGVFIVGGPLFLGF